MKVIITSAAEKEIVQVKQAVHHDYSTDNTKFIVKFHQSGIGILSSCFSISKLIFEKKPDLIIQAGIAGAFDAEVTLGKVVTVKEEFIADTGVEENGNFKDLFDMKLLNENLFPFCNKRLMNSQIDKLNHLKLEEVTGITVNEITTRLHRMEQYRAKYNAAIESMEGASLHYCCLQTGTPFIQIRAISNYIGERDKTKWKLNESFQNLSRIILLYIDCLYKMNQS